MVKENIVAFVKASWETSTLLKSALVKNLKDATEEQIESACVELNLTSSVLVERGLNDQALEVKEQFSMWKVDGIKDKKIHLHQGDEELSVSAYSLTLEDVAKLVLISNNE